MHPKWLSNVVPVKKKNGKIRCCVDFRNLNKACPKDEFPLPNMDMLIDSAVGHAMFSFMDGFSGYNQIRMSSKDAAKTAFRTPMGNFYYTVMPFGLKNAGATYQRAMTAIFHDMMHKEIEDYVDDIVVKSKTREDHLAILRKVFERCRLYKLCMNPLKCAFGVTARKFLGFLVHQRGIDVDPSKVQAIATMKSPTTLTQLKSFLGKLSYIRRFIPGLAALTAVFTPLLKKRKALPLGFQMPADISPAAVTHDQTANPITPTTVRGQAIADLLSNFLGEDSWDITDEIPGDLPAVALIEAAGTTLTLRFNGSSTTSKGGAGIVLSKNTGEAVAMSFELDFTCPNNMAEYEACLTGLVVASEMGIKHLQVIGDSILVVCQARGEFALKEPSLAPYRAMAQRLEDSFEEFNIEQSLRSDNRFADALATLGSKVKFEGAITDVTIVKRPIPIIQMLKEEFFDQPLGQIDWRSSIKEALLSPNEKDHLKVLKDYALMAGELYKKLPGGVLARCLSPGEFAKRLKEVHEKSCGATSSVSLHRRLQRLGYYWPEMSKQAALFKNNAPAANTLLIRGIHVQPLPLMIGVYPSLNIS
ncbi:uncharacterized protein LOC142616433 [Castanea sativa]|uniref:uncharacterized protein LOC142616433 n=1 Tax=Castanea sativa TaxID=21020 RepID=UPI003F64D1BF